MKLSKDKRKYGSDINNKVIVKKSNRFDPLTNNNEDDLSEIVKKNQQNWKKEK